MPTDASQTQERIDDRIRKRARFESFSFAVPEPGQVEITNHSWGDQAESHRYRVAVEDGRAVECSCPHFVHRKQICKHIVKTEQEPAVLAAASVSEEQPVTDGGVAALPGTEPEACDNDVPGCPGQASDELGCFACYREQVARQ